MRSFAIPFSDICFTFKMAKKCTKTTPIFVLICACSGKRRAEQREQPADLDTSIDIDLHVLSCAAVSGVPSNASNQQIFANATANWMVDFNDLVLTKIIGEGSFGRVYVGRWQVRGSCRGAGNPGAAREASTVALNCMHDKHISAHGKDHGRCTLIS